MGGRVPTLTFFGDRRATIVPLAALKLWHAECPSPPFRERSQAPLGPVPGSLQARRRTTSPLTRSRPRAMPWRGYPRQTDRWHLAGAELWGGLGPSQYPYRVFCSLAWRQSDRPRRLERLHFHVLNLLQSPTVVAHPPGAVVAISANPGARAGCGARICSGTWPGYPLDIDTVDDLALLTACPKRRSPFRTVVARVLTELGGSQALPANYPTTELN